MRQQADRCAFCCFRNGNVFPGMRQEHMLERGCFFPKLLQKCRVADGFCGNAAGDFRSKNSARFRIPSEDDMQKVLTALEEIDAMD